MAFGECNWLEAPGDRVTSVSPIDWVLRRKLRAAADDMRALTEHFCALYLEAVRDSAVDPTATERVADELSMARAQRGEPPRGVLSRVQMSRWEETMVGLQGEEIVAALRAYETDHAEYPSGLNALVPDYLPDLPSHQRGRWSWEYRSDGNALWLGNGKYIIVPYEPTDIAALRGAVAQAQSASRSAASEDVRVPHFNLASKLAREGALPKALDAFGNCLRVTGQADLWNDYAGHNQRPYTSGTRPVAQVQSAVASSLREAPDGACYSSLKRLCQSDSLHWRYSPGRRHSMPTVVM